MVDLPKGFEVQSDELPEGFQAVPENFAPIPGIQVPELTPPPEVGSAEGVARGITEGASLNFSDELTGVAARLLGASPEEAQVIEQMARRRTQAAPTGPRIAGNVIGGVGAAAALPGSALSVGGRTLAGRAATGGAIGTGVGALAGAGGAEPGERLEGAATGGALGGALGVAAPLVISGGSAAVRGLRNIGKGAPRSEALARIARVTDDIDAGRLAARSASAGEGSTLADVGGEGVRNLAGTVARTPGPGQQAARNFLKARSLRTGDRLRNLVTRTVSGDDFTGTLEDITNARRSTAKQLYEEAFEANPVIDNPMVQRILASKRGRSAVNKARGFPEFQDMADNDIRLIDQVYKTIGSNANTARRGGDSQLARNMTQLQTSLRAAMPPKYRAALSAYSDDSLMADALTNGRDYILRTPAGKKIDARTIANLPEGEKEMFTIGVSEGLRDMINATPDNQVQTMLRKLFGSPEIRGRMRALFPNSKAFNTFKKGVINESKFVETARRTMGGSPTQERQDAVTDALKGLGVALDIGAPLAQGRVGQAAANIVRAVKGKAQRALPPAQSQELADILFNPSAAANVRAARSLNPPAIPRNQRADELTRLLSQGSIPAVVNTPR